MRNAFTFYTGTTARIPVPHGAVTLAYKSSSTASVLITGAEGGFITFPAPSAPGSFFYQIYGASGEVLGAGTFAVEQNLSTAPAGFDPRSDAAKTLEALDAKIAGRALTIQQSKISIGDRSIEYMNSIDELLKWRDHFARIVAAENGHAVPTAEVLKLRRA